MGTRIAPSYVNLFMGKFEQQAIDSSSLKPFISWRFIDDIFMIWTHGEKHLETSIGYLNSIHTTIKFTHDYSNSLHQTIPFPRCPSSSPSSSHQQPNRSPYKAHRQTLIPPQNIVPPNHTKEAFPLILFLQIRIWSTDTFFDQRSRISFTRFT